MRIVFHNGSSNELKDFGMNLVLLKIFLELMIGPFKYNFFFDKGTSFVKAFVCPFIAN
jgi:hypothetical protein